MSKNTAVSKSLKGASIQSNLANIDTLTVNSLNISSSTVEQLVSGLSFDNVDIINSRIDNTIIGQGGPTFAFFNDLTTYGIVTFYSTDMSKTLIWDPTEGILDITGNLSVSGCGLFGNIDICVNTIKAINNNGSINIIPKDLGSIFLTGPINNTVTSQGNYLTNLANGGVTFLCSDNIFFNSSRGGSNYFTFSDQVNRTINGDISLNTDSGIGIKSISNIKDSGGNIIITSPVNTNLRTGNSVTLSGTNSIPQFDGTYTVDTIYDTKSFSINTTTPLISSGSTGNFIKTPSNNINLNAGAFVKVPTNVPISFSNTTNQIYGNTGGIFINTNTTSNNLGNLTFSMGNTASIRIPVNTVLTFGEDTSITSASAMASINYDSAGNMNINHSNTSGSIIITGKLVQNNALNTRFYDPVLTIGDYTTNNTDLSDRGIEFRYPDPNSTSGNMNLGWFGYKTSTGKFTFYTNATNNNEIITGIPGNFDISTISVSSITINSGGSLDIGCGSIVNVKNISGCNGTININGSNNVNITTGSRLALISGGDIYIPNNIPITIGTSGSYIVENTSGNIILNSNNSVQLNATSGSITLNSNTNINIPKNTIVNLDGTIGNITMNSDTSGNLILKAENNINLIPSSGNVIIPNNTSIQFGSTCNSISGNVSGLNIIASCGSLNMTAFSNANLTSSNGNIVLNANVGDILINLSQGNTRITNNKSIIFSSSGSNNSIYGNTNGNLYITGDSSNGIIITNTSAVNLLASSQINIPAGTFVNFSTDGTRYINALTSGILLISNTVGSTMINAYNTNITLPTNGNINSTFGNLNIINSVTHISSSTFTLTGTTDSLLNLNVENVRTYDPILTLGVSTTGSSDVRDRGIEYYWYDSTAANMKMGWFGWKNSTGQFTFYSDSVNTNEVISGTMGTIALGSAIVSDNLSFINTGSINMNCGTISNLNTITGCSGKININASSQINANTNNMYLNASQSVQIPLNVPLSFGNTSNSIMADMNGNITITSVNGAGKIILNSDVQINGTTENVYSTVTHIVDPIISIGGITSGPLVNTNKDRGIEFYWSPDGVVQNSGFFGFQNTTERFVFIPNGTNTNEVYSGSTGNVQFANGYFNNLDVACGTISNVSTLSGCNANGLTISANQLNASTGSINLNTTTQINFGNTNVSISSDTSGNLKLLSSTGGIFLTTTTSGSGFINIPINSKLQFGDTSTSIYSDTTGNLNILNSKGNIYLTPKNGTNGSVNIPLNNNLIFGETSENSVSSDGTQLNLYGYKGVSINSSTVTFSGDVNILGNINAVSNSIVSENYIYPLGRSHTQPITSIITSSPGNISITTNDPTYLSIGDKVILSNTNSVPLMNGTFIITGFIDEKTFTISGPTITKPGTTGVLNAILTTDQNADVGIQVNYWSNTSGNGITSGSIYYKTAFFGFMKTSGNWVFYDEANVSNLKNVISGKLGNIEINKVNTNYISGFDLTGTLNGGSNLIDGSNFSIKGGSIDNTSIGDTVPETGRFTELTSTISTTLQNVHFQNTLNYAIERISLSTLLQTQDPNVDIITSIISVTGNSLDTYGTMGNAIIDGQIKKIMISSMGNNCTFTLYFSSPLNTPNPLGGTPSQITFKRSGQSAEFLWDNTMSRWILTGGSGGYVS